MQISKRELSPSFEKELKEILAQVIADISSKEKSKLFLTDFLTQTEYIALSKRLAIILYLTKGKSYEEIKKEIKVSSATIASIQSALENNSPGIMTALNYIKAEEFANKWTNKLTNIFGTGNKKSKK